MSRVPPQSTTVICRGLALTVVAVTLAVALACSDDSTGPSASPTTTPSQSAPGNDYGPLAVIEGPGGGPDAGGGKGPLHVTATCVTMTGANGDTVLLVWQNADVTWDDASHEITFARAGGLAGEVPITLRDGDVIRIGGALLDNLTPEMHLDWLATPQPGCGGDRWFVSGVIKE